MWLWLFAGVHNDAKPMQCHGRGRVAGVLWTMDGREIYVSVVCTELNETETKLPPNAIGQTARGGHLGVYVGWKGHSNSV